jgi:hypothetical protein
MGESRGRVGLKLSEKGQKMHKQPDAAGETATARHCDMVALVSMHP